MDDFPAGHKLKSRSKGFQLCDNIFTRLKNGPVNKTVSIMTGFLAEESL